MSSVRGRRVHRVRPVVASARAPTMSTMRRVCCVLLIVRVVVGTSAHAALVGTSAGIRLIPERLIHIVACVRGGVHIIIMRIGTIVVRGWRGRVRSIRTSRRRRPRRSPRHDSGPGCLVVRPILRLVIDRAIRRRRGPLLRCMERSPLVMRRPIQGLVVQVIVRPRMKCRTGGMIRTRALVCSNGSEGILQIGRLLVRFD